MESLRFLRGISSPPLAVGLDARNYPPPAKAKISAAVRAGPAGGLAMEAERDELAAAAAAGEGVSRRRGNWVLKILRVGSLWSERGKDGIEEIEESDRCVGCGGMDGCDVVGEGEEETVEIDRDSFSTLLRRVTVMEAQLYAKMSYLGSLAYTIPKIKPADLLKFHGLRFVTSSLEKKAISLDAAKEQSPSCDQQKPEPTLEAEGGDQHGENASGISANAAYQIAASAATYLQSQTRGILPFGNSKAEIGEHSSEASSLNDDNEGITEIASFVATTNSVTAVVAGKEEMKQAVAKGLNSAHSSPCEWFICDDDKSGTRYFVIQGSESLASWQANLLFEPIQFEGLDVLVHRGIYEAAKGIYEQTLPEVQAHLKSRGNSATFRFTGHSLGGSLSLLVNLMLLIRGEAPLSSLLPVITFGAPTIMCGGDYLLQKLGLPQSHVQAITMHRDIVPRAFSCNYPDHVAKILKAVNGNFRSHPCLQNQKLLYAPMGKFLILQPEEKFSPHHHLLPAGSGLYLLDHSSLDSEGSLRLLRSAQSAFLNSPHPLEILSDRAAYGSDGTVYRDHDVSSYLRSIHGVIRQELKLIRKAKRESRRLLWWPIVAAPGTQSAVIVGQRAGVMNSGTHHFSFAGVLHGGRETLKRFGRMVASQNMQLLIVLLFPARLLVMGTFSLVNFI